MNCSPSEVGSFWTMKEGICWARLSPSWAVAEAWMLAWFSTSTGTRVVKRVRPASRVPVTTISSTAPSAAAAVVVSAAKAVEAAAIHTPKPTDASSRALDPKLAIGTPLVCGEGLWARCVTCP